MPSRPLTPHEFTSIVDNTFAVIRFDADQWGEVGFFYDAGNRQFGRYEMDRKEQSDLVYPLATTEEVLGWTTDAQRPAVEAWLASLKAQI